MNRLSLLIVTVVMVQLWTENTEAASAGLSRSLIRGSGAEGKYVKSYEDRFAYKPDNRGKYVHVHVPYNGGYGPFRNPYAHDGRPYEHDESKYVDDPFKANFFNDKRPKIYREYGAPLFNS